MLLLRLYRNGNANTANHLVANRVSTFSKTWVLGKLRDHGRRSNHAIQVNGSAAQAIRYVNDIALQRRRECVLVRARHAQVICRGHAMANCVLYVFLKHADSHQYGNCIGILRVIIILRGFCFSFLAARHVFASYATQEARRCRLVRQGISFLGRTRRLLSRHAAHACGNCFRTCLFFGIFEFRLRG